MQIRIAQDAPATAHAGALVVPVFSDGELTGPAKDLDAALGGAIAEILQSGEIKGKANEVALVHAKDQPFHRVLVIGLGESGNFETQALARYAGTAVRYLACRNISDIAIALPPQAAGQEAASAAFVASTSRSRRTVEARP